MAFGVALSFSQRDNLYSLQRTTDLQDRTQRRLSSGREVNDVTDDVFRYFAARSLSERADEFIGYNEATEQAIQNIKSSINTIETVKDLFKQMKGILVGSMGKTAEELAAFNEPLRKTLEEAGKVIVDGHYQGTRFLTSDTEKLTVRLSEKFTLDISSKFFFDHATFNAQGAAYGGPLIEFPDGPNGIEPQINYDRLLNEHGGRTYNALSLTAANSDAIPRILENLEYVMRSFNGRATQLGLYVGILQNRVTFTEGYTKELKTGTDAYTLADINQEGAYLVALQTRQQLALNGLAVSGRQNAAVLLLFA